MLISMPTGTSTIFGVFQLILGLPSILARRRAEANLELHRAQRKWSPMSHAAQSSVGPVNALRIPACSTALVSRLAFGLRALGLLRCRRPALHLLLRVLRRSRDIIGCAIHPPGRRVLSAV
jgi:hypothetical protein